MMHALFSAAGPLTSGTTGDLLATCGCAGCRRWPTTWSADSPHASAPTVLSRVSTPTKRFGRMHSQRVNSRRMAVCSWEAV